MSIINNSHAIGVDTRNLVLKTRGTLHVKVGDQYYEIDFRNLKEQVNKEESIKEESIIFLDSKDDINTIAYPGDNKLIVCSDKSLFVTKNDTFIDLTPTYTHEFVSNETSNPEITYIKSSLVDGRLYSNEGYSFDFINGDLNARSITVTESVDFPNNYIKNKCCRTHTTIFDDGTSGISRDYTDYDFIEITEIPDFLVIKSGTIIKSSIQATLLVYVDSLQETLFFAEGGLYIVYEQDENIIMTKLN